MRRHRTRSSNSVKPENAAASAYESLYQARLTARTPPVPALSTILSETLARSKSPHVFDKSAPTSRSASPTRAGNLPSAFPSEHKTTSEFYGFVVYLGSAVAWWLYLLWAFLPDRILHSIGIEWYPNREWALLMPTFIILTVVYIYIAYFLLNLSNTPPLDDLRVLSDSHAHLLEDDNAVFSKCFNPENPDAIPPLFDMPIGIANSVMFE